MIVDDINHHTAEQIIFISTLISESSHDTKGSSFLKAINFDILVKLHEGYLKFEKLYILELDGELDFGELSNLIKDHLLRWLENFLNNYEWVGLGNHTLKGYYRTRCGYLKKLNGFLMPTFELNIDLKYGTKPHQFFSVTIGNHKIPRSSRIAERIAYELRYHGPEKIYYFPIVRPRKLLNLTGLEIIDGQENYSLLWIELINSQQSTYNALYIEMLPFVNKKRKMNLKKASRPDQKDWEKFLSSIQPLQHKE